MAAYLAAACTPTLVDFASGDSDPGDSAPRVHMVAPGDTLYSIAFRYEVDVRDLAFWNDLENPDLILVGQRLFVTSGEPAESRFAGAGAVSAASSADSDQAGASRSSAAAPSGAPEATGGGRPSTAAPRRQASTSPTVPQPAPPAATPIPSPAPPPVPARTAAGSMGAAPAGAGQTAAPRPQPAPPRPQPAPPAQRPSPAALPAPAWQWPIRGPVVSPYGAAQGTGSGIGIGGQLGADIRASAAGQVVYAGDGLAAYGNLVIIKHNDTFLSAYGHNDELVVGEGDPVRQGDVIARMGMGPERQPLVHFEIRRNGTPVNPRGYLPD